MNLIMTKVAVPKYATAINTSRRTRYQIFLYLHLGWLGLVRLTSHFYPMVLHRGRDRWYSPPRQSRNHRVTASEEDLFDRSTESKCYFQTRSLLPARLHLHNSWSLWGTARGVRGGLAGSSISHSIAITNRRICKSMILHVIEIERDYK